jgi:hypothetical protein
MSKSSTHTFTTSSTFNQYFDRTPRVRFNWGFHDGANAEKRGTVMPWESTGNHFDPIYQAGVKYGRHYQQLGIYNEDSDIAWARYEKAEQRDAVVIARLREKFTLEQIVNWRNCEMEGFCAVCNDVDFWAEKYTIEFDWADEGD